MPPKSESLESVFRRVIKDARSVGAPVSPRTLALAVGAAGWKHSTAKLTDRPIADGDDEEK